MKVETYLAGGRQSGGDFAERFAVASLSKTVTTPKYAEPVAEVNVAPDCVVSYFELILDCASCS
jgi:hypothetical protein